MTIKEWLNEDNRLYANGLLLYKRHGNNAVLLRLFESGENSMTRKKLLDELRKIENKEVKPIPVFVAPAPKIKLPADAAKYEGLVVLKNISFKERAALHSQLTRYKTDKERATACRRIMELDTLGDECWFQLDYYDEHATWPPVEDEVKIKTIRDVVQLSKNIPTYFTKINAKLNRSDLSENDEKELLRQKNKWTLIKQRIETILDEPVQF